MAKTYIKDGNGDLKQIDVNDNGRASASNSAPVAISTEDLAAIGSTNETAPATDTAASGLNGRLQRVSQRITSLIGQFPASPGAKAAANSLSVVLASNHPEVQVSLATGAAVESKQDTMVSLLTTMEGELDNIELLIGAVDETAPLSDTASSGLNGRLQRLANRLSTQINLLANNLSVDVKSSVLPTGAATEAKQDATIDALANLSVTIDTTGLATDAKQDSLIAKFPATVGQKAAANSLAVALSTEQAANLSLINTQLSTVNDNLTANVDVLPPTPLLANSEMTHMFQTTSSAGDITLAYANVGMTSRLHRMTVTSAGENSLFIKDGTGGAILKAIEFPVAGAYVYDTSERPYAITSVNKDMILTSSEAVKVTIDYEYVRN